MEVNESNNSKLCQSKSASALKAAGKYQSPEKVKRYVSKVHGSQTDRLETICLNKAVDFLQVPSKISVLDIPCGAGRFLPILRKRDFKVIGADISPDMIESAKNAGYDSLKVADVFDTGFRDKEFDLVICHRLLQYFNETEDRQKALSELHRISRGPVIASFSCKWASDHLWYKIRRFFGATRKRSCHPISRLDFSKNANDANLEVIKWIAARPLISKRWYAIMKPSK